jgi:hypothetical protein
MALTAAQILRARSRIRAVAEAALKLDHALSDLVEGGGELALDNAQAQIEIVTFHLNAAKQSLLDVPAATEPTEPSKA